MRFLYANSWGRYGSIDRSVDMSYTEKEYDYAKEKGMPVLVLMKKEEAITEDEKDVDNDPYDKYELYRRLDVFRKKVKNDSNTVAFFGDLNGLKYEAASTLNNAKKYADQNAGWVRYSSIIEVDNKM